jgi:hypothetical protein
MFVDYSGDRVPVVDPGSDEVSQAEISHVRRDTCLGPPAVVLGWS